MTSPHYTSRISMSVVPMNNLSGQEHIICRILLVHEIHVYIRVSTENHENHDVTVWHGHLYVDNFLSSHLMLNIIILVIHCWWKYSDVGDFSQGFTTSASTGKDFVKLPVLLTNGPKFLMSACVTDQMSPTSIYLKYDLPDDSSSIILGC